MKEHTCQIVSREELVAYTDGDLPQSKAGGITEHIVTCPNCQAMADALERSLQITQAIWKTGKAQWPEVKSFDRLARKKLPFKRAVAVAASILLVLGLGAIWRLLSETSERTQTIGEEAKVAELMLKIAESGDAARLLAAADLLSKYPDAENSVKERYRRIVETYPETAAAAEAKLKLQ